MSEVILRRDAPHAGSLHLSDYWHVLARRRLLSRLRIQAQALRVLRALVPTFQPPSRPGPALALAGAEAVAS